MRFGYQFSNLCGAVYRCGRVVFTPDGNAVLSPIGNRVTVFDLINNKARTLPFENRTDIALLELSPNGIILLSIGKDGRALLINFDRGVVLSHFNFKSRVRAVKFSPDGRFIAATHDRRLQVWRTPSTEKEYAPFTLFRTFAGHQDDITCVDWSSDSKFLVTGSRDLTVRVHRLLAYGYIPYTLSGHKEPLVAVQFASDDQRVYAVTRDGTLFIWRWEWDSGGTKTRAALRKRLLKKRKLSIKKEETTEEDENEDAEEDSEVEFKQQVTAETTDEEAAAVEPLEGDSEYPSRIQRGRLQVLTGGGRWLLEAKHFFNANSKVTSAELRNCSANSFAATTLTEKKRAENHENDAQADAENVADEEQQEDRSNTKSETTLLVVGFANGTFGLYELPSFETIHTLSISHHKISTCTVSPSGEWLAFGSKALGQLLVWEWQSETYILKQQGHSYDVAHLAYSPDGQLIATGGEDGKIKLWNTVSSFCFVTFTQHTAGVTGLQFLPNGNALVSCSLDGTVRAFDLLRYRNFRTLTPPTRSQLTAVSVDPSGEIVVAAGQLHQFDVFVWSLQTGKLLDTLSGHTAPISALMFSPVQQSTLVSASWDKTVRVWDLYHSRAAVETLVHSTEVITCAYRPDGKEIVTSTLDGELSLWEVESGQQSASLNGANDIAGGRRRSDRRTAATTPYGRHFTCVPYSPDGSCLLAGGNSKYVCIYDRTSRILLRKFQISHNRSLDGVVDFLDSREMTEGGPMEADEDTDDADDDPRNVDPRQREGALPGVARDAHRKLIPIRTKSVQFSPNAQSFAAASSEGLLIYVLNEDQLFDPFDVDVSITPDTIRFALQQHEHLKALLMALRLNEEALIAEAFVAVPPLEIPLLAREVPLLYLPRILRFIGKHFEQSTQLEYHLLWCLHLFSAHARYLRANSFSFLPPIRAIQRNLLATQHNLSRLCDDNRYTLEYLRLLRERTASTHQQPQREPKQAEKQQKEEIEQTVAEEQDDEQGWNLVNPFSADADEEEAEVVLKPPKLKVEAKQQQKKKKKKKHQQQ